MSFFKGGCVFCSRYVFTSVFTCYFVQFLVMRSIALSARVPYFLFGPFWTDWDNFSDFFSSPSSKFRWTTTKKWTFGVSQLVLILPVWKCLFLMQSLDFWFAVCVLIVWWKLRSDVFVFFKCALQVSVWFCGICF